MFRREFTISTGLISALSHLDNIGLIQFNDLTGFLFPNVPKKFYVLYCGNSFALEMPKDTGNKLEVGKVLLTKIGRELAPICGSAPVEGFWDYVKDQWKQYLPKSETE